MQQIANQFIKPRKLCQILLVTATVIYGAPAFAAKNNNSTIQYTSENTTSSQNEINNKAEKPTILFVCGGNTGRSPMAEYYTRHKYGKKVNTFSRGSGIAPGDEPILEGPAANLMMEAKDMTPKQEAQYRATPISVTDIYNSDVVITMTSGHKDRLLETIDRECQQSNIDSRTRFDFDQTTGKNNNKTNWENMCKNKESLKAKVHTLSSCATGNYKSIDDGFGKPAEAYPPIRNDIITNINTIMNNSMDNKGKVKEISCIK